MSAVIEELRLRNLGGYREARLKFSEGLNLIRGRNSAGKSTLLDALVFALYGEAHDVKPKLLVSRLAGSGEMAVCVRFRSPRTGEVVEVERRGRIDGKGAYRTEERRHRVGGAEVPVEGEEDLRARVTELMGGVGVRKFLNLVYVRQGELTSTLKPPKEQMDSVLGITLLKELGKQLDEARKHLEKYDGKDAATEAEGLERLVIPQLRGELEGLGGDVEALRGEVQRLEDTIRKGESPELAELLGLIERKEKAEGQLRELRARIQELLRSAGASSPYEFGLRRKELEDSLEKAKAERGSLEKEVEKLQGEWSTLRGRAGALEDQIRQREELLSKKVARCPTCGQDLRPEILREFLNVEKAQLQDLRRMEAEAKESYVQKSDMLAKLKERLAALEKDVSELRAKGDALEGYLDTASGLEKAIEETLSAIKGLLDRLGLPLGPEDPELKVKVAQRLPIGPEELAAKKKELEEKRRRLEEKAKRKEELEEKLKGSEGLLGKLRRRIERANLAKALSQRFEEGVEARRKELLKRIEFKALEFYKAMTDQHVYSAITIDPQDYEVRVHPKGLTEPIPATRVGGGHQTLLALSVRLALLDALGFRHLLILDEPTYGVDSENLPQLASFIGEASRRLSQTILVTHHGICEEEASSIVEVVAREDGTSRAEVKL